MIGSSIGKLKNGILGTLSQPQMNPHLTGKSLQALVKKFCLLKSGAETDLLEMSDEVMASLNFLICVLLRDKAENRLKLWDIAPEIEAEYLSHLTTGLNMSRAHYKLKLETAEKPQEVGNEVSLMVGGQKLPDMSTSQMKEVIQSALNTFDMMECVLCQLKDILNRR